MSVLTIEDCSKSKTADKLYVLKSRHAYMTKAEGQGLGSSLLSELNMALA